MLQVCLIVFLLHAPGADDTLAEQYSKHMLDTNPDHFSPEGSAIALAHFRHHEQAWQKKAYLDLNEPQSEHTVHAQSKAYLTDAHHFENKAAILKELAGCQATLLEQVEHTETTAEHFKTWLRQLQFEVHSIPGGKDEPLELNNDLTSFRTRFKSAEERNAMQIPWLSFLNSHGEQHDPFAGHHVPSAGLRDPFAGLPDPSAGLPDPFAGHHVPFAGHHDPSAGHHDPSAGLQNPFASLHVNDLSLETDNPPHIPAPSLKNRSESKKVKAGKNKKKSSPGSKEAGPA